jgi:hypothetical protein
MGLSLSQNVIESRSEFTLSNDYNLKIESMTVPEKKRRSPLSCLLLLVILVPLGYLAWTRLLVPFFETGGGNVVTQVVPGDAKAFDPIAALPEVAAQAGEGAELTLLDAYYVRSDGTLDLTASYHPYVNYAFVRKVPTPADAPPIGAGGKADASWYEPVTIKAYEPGSWWQVRSGNNSYSYMNRGMKRDTSRPTTSPNAIIPLPKCTFKQLWSAALEKGAPKDAVAVIRYSERGYRFNIDGADIRLEFDLACQLAK